MRALRNPLFAGAATLALYGCSTLIGLGSLEKVDCVDDCAGGAAGQATGGQTDVSGSAGRLANGGAGGGGLGKVGQGGALAAGGNSTSDAGAPLTPPGEAGAAGEAGSTGSVCPGGAAPMATWQEHWFEHDQLLNRVYYDDCAAIYFDSDMAPVASTWLSPFVSKAWAYSVKTYGYLGPDRVYAVFHQGKYGGGHSANFTDPSHDFHNVEDGGATDWTQNYADLTLVLLSFIVEDTAAHTKFGSPAGQLWQNVGWPEFYEYDLDVGLGLNDQAAALFNKFSKTSVDFPRASTFWFRDWFYPLWRDHGQAQVMVNFYGLLEKYYPATNQQMADMNWGEYVHFTSGAAHTNLKALATAAFGWTADTQAQFLQAQTDYPDITY